MNQYKIETVPLPETSTEIDPSMGEETPVEEFSRFTPFKPHQPKCGNGKCFPEVGRCAKCGDVFPCPSGNCGHFDCADPEAFGIDCKGNGTETHDFTSVLDVIQPQNPMARTVLREITELEEGSDQDTLPD